jgi:hypothetical protein
MLRAGCCARVWTYLSFAQSCGEDAGPGEQLVGNDAHRPHVRLGICQNALGMRFYGVDDLWRSIQQAEAQAALRSCTRQSA